jgi:GNAT superfamily N-acetyltransferase
MTARDLMMTHQLLRQLGYDVDLEEVQRRFATVTEAPDHTLLVAQKDDKVVAFLHAFFRPALEKPPEVVVQSLVVDDSCRKTGIGKMLMTAAQRWAIECG